MQKLHVAKWIVSVLSPPIEDGAILVENGLIRAVDKHKRLKSFLSSDTEIINHNDAVLMPGLVNSHCHLELSWLKNKMPEGVGFGRWLRRVIDLVAEKRDKKWAEKKICLIIEAISDSFKNGIFLIGDICNDPDLLKEALLKLKGKNGKNPPFFHVFIEILHPFKNNLFLKDFSSNEASFGSWTFSPHSIYTCSRESIWQIKEFCKKRGVPMTIHCCESEEELEFCRFAKGAIADILIERGRKIEEFFSTSKSPVVLLDEIGVLDKGTICVHCVYLTKDDLEIIKKRSSYICLCPRSNHYIHRNLPPADYLFSEYPENICLGTDSLASNKDLSIFKEVSFLYNRFEIIDPFLLIKAATLNGARALGFDNRLGSITVGKMAFFLKVKGVPNNRNGLYDFICSEAERLGVECIDS